MAHPRNCFFFNRPEYLTALAGLLLSLLCLEPLQGQNVGIGTTTPGEKLEVSGNLKLSAGGEIKLENSHVKGVNTLEGVNGLFLRPAPSSASLLQQTSGGDLVLSNISNNPSILGVHALRGTSNGLHLQGDANSSSDLYIHPNGNIGLNVLFPSDKLHINGNIRLQANDILGLNALVGANGLSLSGNSGPADMFITSNGKVGIGLNNPTRELHVNGELRVESDISVGGDALFEVDAFGVPGGRFRIGPDGRAGFRQAFSNVALAVRPQVSDDIAFLALNSGGSNIFEVQNDADVLVFGDFTVNNGFKNFLMDHPLDPANKTLRHSCLESNEALNVYSGTVVLDGQGQATVALPAYFEAINVDFRYHLTCIGGFAPVYIAQKVADNRFEIAGGTPGLEVSWQVTGRRNDAWVRDHPYQSEEEKTAAEKGRYYYPEGFGMPADLRLTRARPIVEK